MQQSSAKAPLGSLEWQMRARLPHANFEFFLLNFMHAFYLFLSQLDVQVHKISQQQPHIIPWPTQQIHQLSQIICQLSKSGSLATLGPSLTTQHLSTAFQSPAGQLTRMLQSNSICPPLLPLPSLQSQKLLCLSQGIRQRS